MFRIKWLIKCKNYSTIIVFRISWISTKQIILTLNPWHMFYCKCTQRLFLSITYWLYYFFEKKVFGFSNLFFIHQLSLPKDKIHLSLYFYRLLKMNNNNQLNKKNIVRLNSPKAKLILVLVNTFKTINYPQLI